MCKGKGLRHDDDENGGKSNLGKDGRKNGNFPSNFPLNFPPVENGGRRGRENLKGWACEERKRWQLLVGFRPGCRAGFLIYPS